MVLQNFIYIYCIFAAITHDNASSIMRKVPINDDNEYINEMSICII